MQPKWIWNNQISIPDSYVDFKSDFICNGKTEINISADSNYALFINDSFVYSGQYPDFPYYKIYDRIDITPYVKDGINTLKVTVWYYGKSNMSYYVGNAGLWYGIYDKNGTVLVSDENTLCRQNPFYRGGICKNITSQLGLTYNCNLDAPDNVPYTKSYCTGENLEMYPRPIKRLVLGNPLQTTLVKSNSPSHYLYDLGCETVGFLKFNIYSEKRQNITIAFGEHITDGCVRRIIGERDFSVSVTLKAGENDFTNYFRRFGCRYLELFADEPVKVNDLTLIPCDYPLNINPFDFKNELRNQIYSVCVDTLRLCMHEHYEDCPWREQALYTMDSRNQMLCGYYAFSEFEFARANLLLISKDVSSDNLLSICTPTNRALAIPSFSLHFFTQVYEYCIYSKDLSLAKEVYPKLCSIINVFIDRMQNDLVPNFTGSEYWNFYEWSKNMSGDKGEGYSCALNALFSLALQNMQKISELIGVCANYLSISSRVNNAINKTFLDIDSGLYFNKTDFSYKSELTNSLCILCGAATDTDFIAKKLVSESELTPISLSMLTFKYDALLKVDSYKYKEYILNDIDTRYSKMLMCGATSFWETEDGESAFDNAGSLCHGWSAMPIYYYSILKD